MVKNRYKFVYLLTIIITLFMCFSVYVYADDEDEEEIRQEEVNEIVESAATPINEPQINARAAIIYDRSTKQIIWGKNEMEKRAMASTTKIMTAIVVLENANLDDVVTISKKAAGTGGSRLKIRAEDKITVRDLLYGLMLRSGNDAAVALAEHVGESVEGFAGLMNKKAEQIGLKNTHFVTPHGLDDENHYTTAYELAILTDYALENSTFKKIVNTKSTQIRINENPMNIYNTNELLGVLPGVDGIKTGFTNNAGRCLVTSCTREKNQIITVVLGCDTKKQRTSDSTKLIEYAYKNYKRIDIEQMVKKEFENWKQINENRIYINKAKNKKMELELGSIEKKVIPIKNDKQKDINFEINVIYNFEAPVEKNSKIGNIVIKNKDSVIEIVDIICANNIEKKTISDYIVEFIGNIANYKFI